ncbi:MAG: nicotinate phosphoribosyltransferase [Candidatus Latescibacterota bacterium]|nr:MAG: nicotinate phosphoribosyltransferase [Candidatus Latescibacterota bacterium]
MHSRRTPPHTEAGAHAPTDPSGATHAQLGSALFVDLYELTMAQSYCEMGLLAPATFALSVRRLPRDWGFLLAAGLPRALDVIEKLRFGASDLEGLAGTGLFRQSFLAFLAALRFSGSVRAVAEGCPLFADEPLLEVTAPLPQAQILESVLLNAVQLPTLVASKAHRCVHAAAGRGVVDFSMRRTHGVDAAHEAARSSFLAGMEATSNVEAGLRYGIPLVGTMAHSYVLAFASEIAAFRAYAASFPNECVLLVDTYDTIEGVRNAIQVGLEMQARGEHLRGIRLDSGDLAPLSRRARAMLDAAGLSQVKIVASGGLEEHSIAALVEASAAIDRFGVGTYVGVPVDSPTLDIVYKMVDYDGRPVAKRSPAKATLPGRKQIHRLVQEGCATHDCVSLVTERREGRALLEEVVRAGDRLREPVPLATSREHVAAWVQEIPAACRRLRSPQPYRVEESDDLAELRRQHGVADR